MDPAGGTRKFTAFEWLLWTLIPALAVAALASVTDSATRSAGNTNPASVMAGIGTFFVMTVLLVPIVTTLQWLVLRRAWPRLIWPAWLLVVIVSVLALVVAGPIVMMNARSWLYGAIPPILTIGLAAAAAIAIASPKPLRRSAFVIIFAFILCGGALMCGIDTPLIGRLLLEASYPSHSFNAHPSFFVSLQVRIFSFILRHRDLFSLACGTAVSGLGLWLVARSASKQAAMSESRE
jgi:hypothetical protein